MYIVLPAAKWRGDDFLPAVSRALTFCGVTNFLTLVTSPFLHASNRSLSGSHADEFESKSLAVLMEEVDRLVAIFRPSRDAQSKPEVKLKTERLAQLCKSTTIALIRPCCVGAVHCWPSGRCSLSMATRLRAQQVFTFFSFSFLRGFNYNIHKNFYFFTNDCFMRVL